MMLSNVCVIVIHIYYHLSLLATELYMKSGIVCVVILVLCVIINRSNFFT